LLFAHLPVSGVGCQVSVQPLAGTANGLKIDD